MNWLPLLIQLCTNSAHAAPPLVLVGSVAAPQLRTWWRPGELLVASSSQAGAPAFDPLRPGWQTPLPDSMQGWNPLGATCSQPPKGKGQVGQQTAEVRLSPNSSGNPILSLYIGEQLVARGLLDQPVEICSLSLVEADALPGPEILAFWRLSRPGAPLEGLSIFRVPETAQ